MEISALPAGGGCLDTPSDGWALTEKQCELGLWNFQYVFIVALKKKISENLDLGSGQVTRSH